MEASAGIPRTQAVPAKNIAQIGIFEAAGKPLIFRPFVYFRRRQRLGCETGIPVRWRRLGGQGGCRIKNNRAPRAKHKERADQKSSGAPLGACLVR